MPNLLELYSASFRGVPFLVRGTTTDFGRKTVSHEYPQRDDRFVEDLGKRPETYHIRAVLSGSGYFAQTSALNAACSAAGPGQLVHPFYGILLVACKKCTLVEDLTSYGEALYDLDFEVTTQNPITPLASINPTSNILNATASLYNAVQSFIGTAVNVSQTYSVNLARASDNVVGVLTEISNVLATFGAAGTVGAVQALISSTLTQVTNLVNNPLQLAATIPATMAAANTTVLANPTNAISLNTPLVTYGAMQQVPAATSAATAEAAQNQLAINSAVQAIALGYIYEATTLQTFLTNTDIDAARLTLEGYFQNIVVNGTLDDDSLDALETARDVMRQFFEQQSLSAYKVIVENVAPIPVAVLAYQYYGDLAFVSELISLNNVTYPSIVQGEFLVLGQ